MGDTSCEKLPVEMCGAGCTLEEGEEECQIFDDNDVKVMPVLWSPQLQPLRSQCRDGE